MKWKEKDRNFLFILMGLAVLIVMDVLVISSYVRNYNEKISILCVMLEEQEKGTAVNTATELLKGAEAGRGEAGREVLES